MPEGCTAMQKDPKRLLDRNLMKFNKGKGQFLHLRRNNLLHWYMAGYNQVESNFAEKDWGILVETRFNMSQNVQGGKQYPGLL